MQIHSETCPLKDKSIQSKARYRYVLRTHLNHLASLANWLSLRLPANWLWVRVHFQLLTFQILHLLRARSSLTFRQLQIVDSLWNKYMRRQEDTIKCTVQISTQNTAQLFWPVRRTRWVFVFELSNSGFQCSWSHSNLRFLACLEEAVPWYSANYRVWIHSKTHTWHDTKIQSNTPYR